MAHDVFISHAHKDKQVADAVCAALEAQRIRCWIASRDLTPGAEYAEALVNAIADAQIFVVVFSSDANESPQVKREVERAVSKGKIILPFRIDEVIPSKAMEYCLSNTHWLDAMTPPLETHLARLVETVARLLHAEAPRTPPQIAPAVGLPTGSESNSFEYRSKSTVFGLPWVHIAVGLPRWNGRRRSARGVLAIGDSAQGVVAIGSRAMGVIAMGTFAMGVLPFGLFSFGVFSVGAFSLGLGLSYGLISIAPAAIGAVAAGICSRGSFAFGVHVWPVDQMAQRFFTPWVNPLFHSILVVMLFVAYFSQSAVGALGRFLGNFSVRRRP